jgi:pectinesterase
VGRALQQANLGKDVGGGQKDAILASAETTIKVNNGIDPATELGGEDGEYKTISESIDNIPENNTKRYVLHLKRGTVFREKVFLNKSKPLFVTLMSDPANPDTIVWNDTATTTGKDGKPHRNVGSTRSPYRVRLLHPLGRHL